MSLPTSMLESFVSAHVLLIISSIFAGRFLLPSASKLFLARVLFAACIIAPLAVHLVRPANKPILAKFVNLDGMRKTPSKPGISAPSQVPQVINPAPQISENIDYGFYAALFAALLISFRGFQFVLDLRKIRAFLRNSQAMRRRGHLSIHISDQCLVPFSVRTWARSYIVLPVSMLNSSADTKIAIAHEGQHHRQGDCLFAYVLECASILFFGNPAIARWKRVFTELQ